MRLPRLLMRIILLCSALLAVTASLAAAAHVAGVLPLTANTNHSNEKFSATVFPAADYSFYSFAGADLSNCTFAPGSNLTGATFIGAKLTNVNFSGCDLDYANFLGADLSFAVVPCLGAGDFRGAILTGVTAGGTGCASCATEGPSWTDACTVNPLVNLCTSLVGLKSLVSGVVFDDLNSNGQLDFGEPGIPGATVNVVLPPVSPLGFSDARGGYFLFVPNGGVGTVNVSLPLGFTLAGPASQPVNLAACRSSQAIHFPAHSQVTPAQRSTFARVKALYR